MEDIIIEYNKNKKNVIINHFNNTVINENNDKGYFKLNENILKIIWNNTNFEEIFILINNKNNINIYNFTEKTLIKKKK